MSKVHDTLKEIVDNFSEDGEQIECVLLVIVGTENAGAIARTFSKEAKGIELLAATANWVHEKETAMVEGLLREKIKQ